MKSPYEMLAKLIEQAADVSRKLADEHQIQVAAGANRSDITCVKLLTVSDMAKLLRVAPKTIRRWRIEGRLPVSIEIGGVIRWEPAVVERWLKEQSA